MTPYQEALAEHGVSKTTAEKWQRYAAVPPQEFEEALIEARSEGAKVSGEVVLKKLPRKRRDAASRPAAVKVAAYDLWNPNCSAQRGRRTAPASARPAESRTNLAWRPNDAASPALEEVKSRR